MLLKDQVTTISWLLHILADVPGQHHDLDQIFCIFWNQNVYVYKLFKISNPFRRKKDFVLRLECCVSDLFELWVLSINVTMW